MMKLAHSPQFWSCEAQTNQDKQKLSELYGVVCKIKDRWVAAFEQSIQLWINFVHLRLQIIVKQTKLKKTEGDSVQLFEQIQKQLSRHICESEIAVLKGLKNVQKLYMVPDLRPRSHSKDSKSIFDKSTPKTIEKSRSSSFNSTRNQKSSIFAPTKTITEISYKKMNSQTTTSNFSRANSTLTKQYKQKPKFQQTLASYDETSVSAVATDSRKNFNTIVSKEMTQELQSQLTKKEKMQQEELVEMVSNKLESKLKSIETDLNTKLDTIIEGLSRAKLEQNKENTQNSDKRQAKQSKPRDEKILKVEEQIKIQKPRRNSMMKRITSNPITEEISDLDSVQLQSVNQKTDKLEKVYLAEKNLQEFVSLTKKIKLPISESLIRIFVDSYVGMCREAQTRPNVEKFGFAKWQWENRGEGRVEMKQAILKLNKLINMDGLNGKGEKIKAYLEQCLRCCYCLFLKEEYELKQQVGVEVNRIIGKL